MSQENVEIVRRIFEEWERGNFSKADYLDPDVRFRWVNPILVSRGETRGLAELAEGVKEFLKAWEGLTARAEQIIDAGETVVAIEEWRGRGKASGAPTQVHQASVWTISDGKVIRVVVYADRAEALEAAGLGK
jgi:ketosteroid isomerase-like protein